MLTALLLTLTLATPKVGDVAPDFIAKDSQGKELKLSQLVQKGPVVLAFFPKAFTGGCTQELTQYTQRYQELEAAGATLLAVATDKAETMEKFRQSLNASFSFVPDPNADLTRLYDVKAPVLKIAKRTTFVIGEDRKILRVDEGSDAVNPDTAIKACPLKQKTKS
jgi:peroxiredoxin Q/BCP